MKPLPLAILVILVWTVLVIVGNWPRETATAKQPVHEEPELISSNPPTLQIVEQPRYHLER